MVKVIGEDPQAVKQRSCRNCAAKLEYTLSDVQSRHGTDISGNPDGREWIVCPRCGSHVIIRSW